jgi:hypothetical protein
MGHSMGHSCTYCGYNSLRIVRDYTGAPYATCPRCYRANAHYRVNPQNSATEKKPAPKDTAGALPKDTAPSSGSTPIA